MSGNSTLNVDLAVDIVSGDIKLNFDPVAEDTLPGDVAEWSQMRADLRRRIRTRLESDPNEWAAYLDSNRASNRLGDQLTIGQIVVSDDGEIVDERLAVTSVADID